METFREWLLRRLDEEDMSRADLARQVGVDASTVSNWATGKDIPRPERIVPIAQALAGDALYLLSLCGYLPATLPPAQPRPRSLPALLREVQSLYEAAMREPMLPVLGSAGATARGGVDADTGEPGRRFGYEIVGDCLAPDIAPGELVVFDRERSARVGDVVMAVVNGERHVKRVVARNGRWTLADNSGEVILPMDDAAVYGVKVDVWQRKET